MGIGSLLDLGRDALAAHAFGLDVAGQNVANVNTPGYVRRDAILENRIAGNVTYGGVQVKGLRRIWDQFVGGRYLEASGHAAAAGARDGALQTVEGIFNDTDATGLGDPLSAFFASLGALAANPTDTTVRTQVLARADDLGARFRGAAASLGTLRQDLWTQAQGTAAEINDRAAQIAKLNAQIAAAKGLGYDAADLEDRRESLAQEIAERVDVRTFVDGAGKLVVRAAGATLVEGDVAATMTVGLDGAGALKLTLQRSGGIVEDVTSGLSGGRLGGIRKARDDDAAAALARLDQLAWDVATAVNAQHAAGFGLDGVTGRVLFSIGGAPTGTAAVIAVDANMVGQPSRVAAAANAPSLPGGADNAVLLAALASAKIANGATRTATEAWSDAVGDVGLRKAQAADDVEMRGEVESQAKAMLQSTSGVSLDEEMINLTRYQRAYEAATRLVRLADELLENVMAIKR